MTPDQLPAGLPMDDKIEAWRNGLLQLVLKHARLYSDHEDAGVVEAAYVAICDYLRTTPEGYRLVDQLEIEALRKDAERYRWLRDLCGDTSIGVYEHPWDNTMRNWLANDQLDAAIDAALQEQSKC